MTSHSGPGAYEIDRSVSATKARSRAAIISQEKRTSSFVKKDQSSSAGPGAYGTYREFGKDNKSSFTIGTRSEKKIEMSAGPGAYQVDKSASATKTRVSSAVFTKQ